MHRAIKRILPLAAVVASLLAASSVAAEQVLPESNTVVVTLCLPTNPTAPLQLWNLNIAAVLARLSVIPSIRSVAFKVKGMPLSACADVEKTACQSRLDAVFCNSEKLARILFSQAYIAASYVVLTSSNTKHRGSVLDIYDVLLLWGAVLGNEGSLDSAVDKLVKRDRLTKEEFTAISRVVEDMRKFEVTLPAPRVSPEVAFSYDIYEAASNYIMGFIVGHELSHAYGRCLIEEPSSVETNELLPKLVSFQTRGDVLCPNPLYLDELKADRCAFRIVQEFDEAMIKSKSQTQIGNETKNLLLGLLAVSRGMAINSMFYYLLIGLQPGVNEALVSASPKFGINFMNNAQGYLYGGLRGILFSEVLRQSDKQPKKLPVICDSAARDLVHLLDVAVGLCQLHKGAIGPQPIDHSGLVGAFSDFVPPGVVKAWVTNVWHDGGPDDSFSCVQKPRE